jgi:hypothetical protein
MEKKFLFHIGLPKTATSSMQANFFPQFVGFIGWKIPGIFFHEFAEIWCNFNRDLGLGGWQQELSAWISKVDFSIDPVQIISFENASSWHSPREQGSSHWPVVTSIIDTPRNGTHPITIFLKYLAEALPPDVSLLTVVTLRNQSDFLGSLTAQVAAEGYPHLASMSDLIESQDAFLDYFKLVTDLEQVVGASNHLTLLFEDGFNHNCEKIVAFGNLASAAVMPPFDPKNLKNNRRQFAAGTWRITDEPHPLHTSKLALWLKTFLRLRVPRAFFPTMRVVDRLSLSMGRKRTTFQISLEDRVAIREYCQPSNARLAQHLKKDLTALGY